MTSRSILRPLTVLALTFALVPALGVSAQQPTERRGDDMVVRVDNHNWLDMHIYYSRGGGPLQSLGMVTSLGSAVFHVPHVSGTWADIRIIADPIGGSGIYVSPTMLPSPESEIVLTVQNALDLSFTSIGPRRDSD